MALPTVEITCVQCGATAIKFRTGGKPARYCGNACKIAAHRSARPDKLQRYREREAAKLASVPRQPKARLCSCGKPAPLGRQKHDECLTAHREGKACRDCGALTDKWQQRCSPCREAATTENKIRGRHRAKTHPAYKAQKRADKARRRAIERSIHAERFDPFEIFERDNWRCHLCGCVTPRKLRGTYDDRAPELDHIVPLSAGGQHTRANTACSCRKCNGAKSDKPLGQLRLVA